MKKIVIVTGSARPNSANKQVVSMVEGYLKTKETVEVVVADVAALGLPFFDAEVPPSNESYVITHESVRAWSKLINSADGVVFVAPEYNHGLSAIQKNAIDWLFQEWTDKPVAFVAYGWHAGENTLNQFGVMSRPIKWSPVSKAAGLQFTKDLSLDGSSLSGNVPETVQVTLDELVSATGA